MPDARPTALGFDRSPRNRPAVQAPSVGARTTPVTKTAAKTRKRRARTKAAPRRSAIRQAPQKTAKYIRLTLTARPSVSGGSIELKAVMAVNRIQTMA